MCATQRDDDHRHSGDARLRKIVRRRAAKPAKVLTKGQVAFDLAFSLFSIRRSALDVERSAFNLAPWN